MTTELTEILLTDRNFREEVLENNEPVLVDFYAEWLTQCKNIPSIVNELGKAIGAKLIHARAKVDICYRTAEEYGVRAFPTFFLFKNGVVVDQVAGAYSDDEMLGRLKFMLQSNG